MPESAEDLAPTTTGTNGIRPALLHIADLVAPGSRVLDVGCGDGTLLGLLADTRGVDARGVEISQAGVNACVSQGLSVIQGDADTDLYDYPAGAFDYAILSETLQATRHPRDVLRQLLVIGRHAIVSFPNFGYWPVRWQLLWRGRMPVTKTLAYSWYDTPNIHLCTIKDFTTLCAELGIVVERAITIDRKGQSRSWRHAGTWANVTGNQAIFLLRKPD